MITKEEVRKWKLADLEQLETVGTGTFGRVRICRHKETSKFCALKIMKKQEILRMKQVDHTLSEASILSEIHHPFIVNMLKGYMDEDHLYILMEYIPGGELFSHLRKAGNFPNDVAKFYSSEVVLAFEYLHSKEIVYRDLKPENVLINYDGNIKITDFGFAKRLVDRTFTLCGTPEYLAPEIIHRKGHGKPVDWWALGILLYEMLVGYPPFFDEHPYKIYERILEGKVLFPKWVDKHAKDLIRGLLTPDCAKRLGSRRRGVHDIKHHTFFLGINWDLVLARKQSTPMTIRVHKPGDTCYFDKYPESPRQPLRALTPAQQEVFANFCDGNYAQE